MNRSASCAIRFSAPAMGIAIAALALATASSALAASVRFTGWTIETKRPGTRETAHTVKPKAIFYHCKADKVVFILAKGKVKGVRKGDSYVVTWKWNGHRFGGKTGHWTRSGSFSFPFYFSYPAGFPDGKYSVAISPIINIIHIGRPIGSTSVRFAEQTNGC